MNYINASSLYFTLLLKKKIFFLAFFFRKHLLIIDRECYSLFEGKKKNFSGKARSSKLLIIKEFIINNNIKYNINNIIVLSKQVMGWVYILMF